MLAVQADGDARLRTAIVSNDTKAALRRQLTNASNAKTPETPKKGQRPQAASAVSGVDLMLIDCVSLSQMTSDGTHAHGGLWQDKLATRPTYSRDQHTGEEHQPVSSQ